MIVCLSDILRVERNEFVRSLGVGSSIITGVLYVPKVW